VVVIPPWERRTTPPMTNGGRTKGIFRDLR
jgi:hypothetical protein